ncbi:aldehyde dehydrogenase family protein [Antrihabitans sp. YC3-6]|uniref:Aldehyde dehydrogenase n=1 Tax=Antrihabitans stalagmiti TaxID=2799499 RepID=A0A934NP48_9NOCA|nr:aldehyde dehydrogenase family protein [Antrihabitans stalagmiti]MBJ8338725.1 aldehyde dehydrogenase family protein [Antrihabitans stalagmiti]
MTSAPVAPPRTSRPAILESIDPATGAVIAEWPIHDSEGVAAAVSRARVAASVWRELDFEGRKRALLRWASYLSNHADELCELVLRENGKPAEDAYLELVLVLEHIDWAAKNAKKTLSPKKVSPGLFMANCEAVIEQRPLGVVGVIGPWNYPVYTPNGSIAYALAAGNAIVFKPSEYTVSIGHFYADAFAEANPELPLGILSVVNGYGETGAALVTSGVDKIAFTGSTATGKRIMAAAAANLTPVLLECGGKDAAIVADDADLTAAADAIAWSVASNSGQTCAGTERIYVVESVYDAFVEKLAKNLRNIKPGSDAKAAYGPMTMPSQIEVVRRHIADALDKGGRAIVGGLDSIKGSYIEPVVLVDVPEDSLAVAEETFGPTVTVRSCKSIDEAIELANDSAYALASTVYSRKNGMEIARKLRVGATSVNSVLAFGAISTLPFGGVGESGIGRIHGEEGMREFTRSHSIARQRFAIPGMELLSFSRKASTVSMIRKIIGFRHGRHT